MISSQCPKLRLDNGRKCAGGYHKDIQGRTVSKIQRTRGGSEAQMKNAKNQGFKMEHGSKNW